MINVLKSIKQSDKKMNLFVKTWCHDVMKHSTVRNSKQLTFLMANF